MSNATATQTTTRRAGRLPMGAAVRYVTAGGTTVEGVLAPRPVSPSVWNRAVVRADGTWASVHVNDTLEVIA